MNLTTCAKALALLAILATVVLGQAVFRQPVLYRAALHPVAPLTPGAGLDRALPRDAYASVLLITRNRLRAYQMSPKLYSRAHFLTWVRVPEASYPVRHTTASADMIGRREHFADPGCKVVDRQDRMAYARCGR